MKRKFVQPRARQNSEFTEVRTSYELHPVPEKFPGVNRNKSNKERI